MNDARSKRCADCGFTFYQNASAATVAVVVNERGELLCVVRSREPARGTLDLPGGFVDPGEGIDEGCLRELREEVGAEAEIERFLFSLPNVYPFGGFDVATSDAFFLCRLLTPPSALRAADDAASLRWVCLADVSPSAFGLASVSKGVARLKALFAARAAGGCGGEGAAGAPAGENVPFGCAERD